MLTAISGFPYRPTISLSQSTDKTNVNSDIWLPVINSEENKEYYKPFHGQKDSESPR